MLALGRPPNEERLAHVEELPARPPSPVPFPDDLDPRLWSALVGGGITELYSHQREVWERSRTGAHVGVVTGTASGKTLAYALPVIAALLDDPHARALYLSPTKALAQDQARTLKSLHLGRALRPALYDGDTDHAGPRDGAPAREPAADEPRHAARRHLPARRPLGRRAREPDACRDRRGARLPGRVRLARRERDPPSAPRLRGGRLVAAVPARIGDGGEPRRDDDGAGRRPGRGRQRRRRRPAGAHRRAVEPDAARPRDGRARVGAGRGGGDDRRARGPRPAGDLLRPLAAHGRGGAPGGARDDRASARRTCATRSRPTGPATRPSSGASSSGGYPRASCGPSWRRTRSSSASTSGMLDCAISIGFPGTVASLRQQWGRAGRSGAGLAVLVASADALDQYFIRHPAMLTGRPVEAAILDHASPEIRRPAPGVRRLRGADHRGRRRHPRRRRLRRRH